MAEKTIEVDGVQYREITKPRNRLKEFSKRVIAAMTVVWFAAAVFAGVVIWKTNAGLDALLTFVGAPMTGGIIGYMAKTAFENKEKIKSGGVNDEN